MTEQPSVEQEQESLETSNYEIIRRRLVEHGRQLAAKADDLNQRREAFFGSTSMEVIGNETIRTENNCIPQDIVNLGDRLLFGYNVKVKKKSKIQVGDVFSLHKFMKEGDELILRHLPQDVGDNFLGDEKFNKDFDDLYTYFTDAFLRQIRRTEGRLLAVFQTGSSLTDTRTLRWNVDDEGVVSYMDNAGGRDNTQMTTHDFVWESPPREKHVKGKYPHINILDEVFVETVGGDLTIKVENNTESGEGIYAEGVEDKNQSLGDATIHYARLGELILLRIRPYREEHDRCLVFNCLTKTVVRVDAINLSCLPLPEDHGVIFPGGYVLESGETKTFDMDIEGMRIEEVVRSPNGEDVMYVFYRDIDGTYLLLSYNLIRKEVQNPITCHGYSIFDDGTMIVFKGGGENTSKVHPMQIWRTAYMTPEFAANVPSDGSFLSKIGNADLVRAISDAYTIRKMINNQEPTLDIYTSLIRAAERMLDNYYWLNDEQAMIMDGVLREVVKTSELVIEEFNKVRAMRLKAKEALANAREKQSELFASIRYANWGEIDRFVDGLDQLRGQRGRLITMRELKYVDQDAIDVLEEAVVEQYDKLSRSTVQFLLGDAALVSYSEQIQEVIDTVEALENTVDANDVKARIDRIGEGLNLLTEVISGLKIDDPTARTQILEAIAEVLGQQNRSRAMLDAKRRALMEQEGKAEFAVQFQLLSQSITGALGMVDSPEKCDEQMTRLMVQLEDMESRFSEFDSFLLKLTDKRDEIVSVFETKKQQLLDERQRKAASILESSERMLSTIRRRAQNLDEVEALNAFFAADTTVSRLREMIERLRDLKEAVKADDLNAQIKALRDQSIRSLRDKQDLFEGGDAVIKLGRHRFSINTQPLELTMVPRDKSVMLHITGTDFYEPIGDETFLQTRHLWDQHLVSENREVYRVEYLVASMLFDAERRAQGYSVDDLHEMALVDDEILKVIRKYIEVRYDEGYERGVHDLDAMHILRAVLGLYITAGLLRFGPQSRAVALLFWAHEPEEQAAPKLSLSARRGNALQNLSPAQRARTLWQRRAQSLGRLRAVFGDEGPIDDLIADVVVDVRQFVEDNQLPFDDETITEGTRYLIEELIANEKPKFVLNATANDMMEKFLTHLDVAGTKHDFEHDLSALEGEVGASWSLIDGWLRAFLRTQRDRFNGLDYLVPEVIASLITQDKLDREVSSARGVTMAEGLLGQHARIEQQKMEVRLDEFLTRLHHFAHVRIPEYKAYRKMSTTLLDDVKRGLRLEELKPRVLSTFVRNKLINDVYLEIIGDNLAKQMGTVGDSGNTSRMGLLLLMSPPGYGKTTLMEYVANRLGLTFMKINGPAIGHHVTSIDPSEAPNATARQEVEKINLALRMGNNVMLYLDDIQHTNPELLQKFISLCDGTRRIEGVWDGKTKTYDLRGKRFSVVMAGNPYTETGERFQIPDMLSNRADTYNLGDMLEGSEEVFALSYIENALTANSTLAPLANREREDIYRFIRMAQGEQIPLSELEYEYSAQEAKEIVEVLEKLFVCQKVLLKVNQLYIQSAAQEDAYRTEPPFKLQGSYRNMTKLAEKVVAAMNDQELDALIDDHYAGEAQTLTTESEQNLLKLAELRGKLTVEQRDRWEEIKREFKRRKMLGGAEDDPVTRVVGPLTGLVERLDDVHVSLQRGADVATGLKGIQQTLADAASAASSKQAEENANAMAKLADVLSQMNQSQSQNSTQGLEAIMKQQVNLMQGTLDSLVRIVESYMQNNAQPQVQMVSQLRALEKWMQQGGPALQGPPPSSGQAPVQYVTQQPVQPQSSAAPYVAQQIARPQDTSTPKVIVSGVSQTRPAPDDPIDAIDAVAGDGLDGPTTQKLPAVNAQRIAQEDRRDGPQSFKNARKSQMNLKPLSEEVSDAYDGEDDPNVQLRPPFTNSNDDQS